MILVVAERVNAPRLSDERVAAWRRLWEEHLWAAAERTPSMTYGPTRRRLLRVLDLGEEGVDVRNLLPPDNRCGTWDTELAGRVADDMIERLAVDEYDAYVLLGRRVIHTCWRHQHPASGLEYEHHGETMFGRPVLHLPHTSGLNRFWNTQDNRDEAARWVAGWKAAWQSPEE